MMVKADHQVTMRISTDFAPRVSAQRAVGISKIAYARAKLENTHPSWTESRPNSTAILGAMTPMQARSRYVIMASVTMKKTTTWRVPVG